MKMIPVNSGTQLHVVGAAAKPGASVPQSRERVPALVSTTVNLPDRPKKRASPRPTGGHESPPAVVETEPPQPTPTAAAAAKGTRKAARKKAALGAHRPEVATTKGERGKSASGVKPAQKRKQQAAGRGGTKKEAVLALLRRAQGATVAEMMKATGWQSHSVRGFLSGAVKKKLGLKVKSGKRDNGERVYSIRG